MTRSVTWTCGLSVSLVFSRQRVREVRIEHHARRSRLQEESALSEPPDAPGLSGLRRGEVRKERCVFLEGRLHRD